MHNYRNEKLRRHMEEEHKQNPLSGYLREIVYGGIDGIVTTFAVVAGFSGASLMGGDVLGLTFATVLLFGLANLFGDAFSMALGNFLSIRTEKEVYKTHKDKEAYKVKNNTALEAEETVSILVDKGFSKVDAIQLQSLYQKNSEYWINWMMNHELEMPNPEGVNPVVTGSTTFATFLLFGSIPLLPYIFTFGDPVNAFVFAIISTFIALVLLGFVKGKVIGGGVLRSVIEIVLLGTISASVAFFVGTFFNI